MSEFKDEEASLSVNLSEESEASDSVIFRKIENFTNQPKNESAVSLSCSWLLASKRRYFFTKELLFYPQKFDKFFVLIVDSNFKYLRLEFSFNL